MKSKGSVSCQWDEYKESHILTYPSETAENLKKKKGLKAVRGKEQ